MTAMAATADGALYAGTNAYGIYKSTNQGASWTAVNSGISSRISYSIDECFGDRGLFRKWDDL